MNEYKNAMIKKNLIWDWKDNCLIIAVNTRVQQIFSVVKLMLAHWETMIWVCFELVHF